MLKTSHQDSHFNADLNRRDAQFWAALVLISVAAFCRLLPHPPNVSPLTAIALFGGAAFVSRRGLAMLIPVVALFVSDLALGFHDQMAVVYGSFLLMTWFGQALGGKFSLPRVALGSISGSTLFFVTTNLSVWLTSGLYPVSLDGLVACFVAALPFFQNSMIGDLFFSVFLFAGWAWLRRQLHSSLSRTETVN